MWHEPRAVRRRKRAARTRLLSHTAVSCNVRICSVDTEGDQVPSTLTMEGVAVGLRDKLDRLAGSVAAGTGVMLTGRPFRGGSHREEHERDAAAAHQLEGQPRVINHLGRTALYQTENVTVISVQRGDLDEGFADPALGSGLFLSDSLNQLRAFAENLPEESFPADWRERLDQESTQTSQLPAGWIEYLDGLKPAERVRVARLLSVLPETALSGATFRDLVDMDFQVALMAGKLEKSDSLTDGMELPREELAEVAVSSEGSIDHALAMMFIRLGPPPEPTEVDYVPASSGGGGAQQ